MNRSIQKVCAIHDLCGLGHVSLNEAIVILSTMKHQVIALPTSVFSANTSYENFKYTDLTFKMQEFIDHWKTLNLQFDAIYSGFLGSHEQISIVSKLINDFKKEHTIVLVDPVFGDNGELYPCFDYKIVVEMRKLISHADIITPNITEAAFLLQEEVKDAMSVEETKDWCRRLSEFGPETVVITSVPELTDRPMSTSLAYDKKGDRFWKVSCEHIPASFTGTGDAFASVLLGSLLQGDSLPIALDRAVHFVLMGIRSTFGLEHDPREGMQIERVLNYLNAPIPVSTFEII